MGAMNHTYKSCITWKRKIKINWNFGNKLFLFISSDSCHKMILLESLIIPLRLYLLPYIFLLPNVDSQQVHEFSVSLPHTICSLDTNTYITNSRPKMELITSSAIKQSTLNPWKTLSILQYSRTPKMASFPLLPQLWRCQLFAGKVMTSYNSNCNWFTLLLLCTSDPLWSVQSWLKTGVTGTFFWGGKAFFPDYFFPAWNAFSR